MAAIILYLEQTPANLCERGLLRYLRQMPGKAFYRLQVPMSPDHAATLEGYDVRPSHALLDVAPGLDVAVQTDRDFAEPLLLVAGELAVVVAEWTSQQASEEGSVQP